jgi:clan AA aspartic protease
VGTFTVPIQIGSLAGAQFTEVTALVDTGSTYSTLPGSLLARLGVVQEGYRRFELADNRVVEYPIGQARLRLEGQELIVLVVFALEDTDALLGATTLEIFGLGVDPIRQQLVPVTALLK